MPEPTLPPSTAGPSTGRPGRPRRGPLCPVGLYVGAYAAMLLIAAGIVIAVMSYGSSQIRDELERLRSAGAPVSMAQAAPPLIPAEQNAAPVYLEAAKLLQPHKYQWPDVGTKPGEGREEWRPDNLDGDGWANWSAPETVKALSAMLKSDDRALELVYQAASRPGCRFDLKWPDGIDMLLPHLSELRLISSFCAVATAVAAAEENAELTGQRLHANVGLACHAAREPLVVSQMTTHDIVGLAKCAAECALSRVVVPEPQARAILSQVTGLDLTATTVAALRTERAMAIEFYDIARRTPSAITVLISGLEARRLPGDWVWWVYARGIPRMLNVDELAYLHYADWSLRTATLPWAESQREYKAMDEWADEHLKKAYVADSLGPRAHEVAQRRFETQTLLNLISGSLGLALYKQKTGQFPQSLNALAQINWPVPQDPFTDAPMKYRPQGDRYLLYSVGKDGLDDGGKPVWKMTSHPPGPPPNDQDLGDIPWQWR